MDLGTDIKLDEQGDLTIDNVSGDFVLVQGKQCLTQDIQTALGQTLCDDVFSPWEGMVLTRQNPHTQIETLASERGYKEALNDPRIKENSIEIVRSQQNGKTFLMASFDLINGERMENFIL